MADETDGRAIVNRNDLGGGLAQMMRDASAYYLLGYSSAAAPTDGRFHQIRVRVKRPGVEVRARKGYWALRADEAASLAAAPKAGPPPDVNIALSEIDKVARAKNVRTWVGYAPDPSGKTRVLFTWEPVAGAPGGPAPLGDLVSQVTVMAVNETEGPVYRGKVPAVGPSAPGTGVPTPGGGQTSFLITPGVAQVKVSVEGDRRKRARVRPARPGRARLQQGPAVGRHAGAVPGAHGARPAGPDGGAGRPADRRPAVQPHREAAAARARDRAVSPPSG